MQLSRWLAKTPSACRAAGSRLEGLGFRPEGEGFVRGTLYFAIFAMDPRRWLTRLRFVPDAGGTRLTVDVETRFQILTATERAFLRRELDLVESLLLGQSSALAPVMRHGALARVENWSINALSVIASASVGFAILALFGSWLLAGAAAFATLMATFLGLLAWIRWRPLTDDERGIQAPPPS